VVLLRCCVVFVDFLVVLWVFVFDGLFVVFDVCLLFVCFENGWVLWVFGGGEDYLLVVIFFVGVVFFDGFVVVGEVLF